MNARSVLKNAPVTIGPEMARHLLAKVRRLQPETVQAVANEIVNARLKFPGNKHLLAALVEEVGELSKAYLQGAALAEVVAEALQVACVALRIAEEGDADFGDSR